MIQPGTLTFPGAPRRSRAAALLCLFLGLGTLAVLPGEHGAVYAIAVAFLACLVVPAWMSAQRGTFDAFETVNVLGLQYFMFYGLGAIWSLNDPGRVAYDTYLVPFIPRAAFYALLGYLAFLAGYFAPFVRYKPRPEQRPSSALVMAAIAGVGLLGSLSQALHNVLNWHERRVAVVAGVLGQLAPLFVIAWSALWMLYLSRQATRPQRLLLGMMVPAAALVGYRTFTSKATTIVLVAVPLIALWYARRKIPWRTLIVMGIVIVFVVFPFFNRFRELDPRIPDQKRAEITYNILARQSAGEYFDSAVTGFKERMALVNSVAVVIRDVGRWVPYARGETIFGPALAFAVPRVLWPDKPFFTTGRDFGVRFRVVNAVDTTTAIAPTVPGELYWNFDLPGILIGMGLWGLGLRWLYLRYGRTEGLDPLRRGVHVALLVIITHFDGGIAGHGAAVIRYVVLFEALLWFGRRAGLVRKAPAAAISA